MKEKILAAIVAEFERQGKKNYVEIEADIYATLDGYFDLDEVAEAVVKALTQSNDILHDARKDRE